MFTCILGSIYFITFTLGNKEKFIASKELDTLNIRFTLMKHKQLCIWLVFSGKTDMLQSMGSQRIRHDLKTEQPQMALVEFIP